MRRSRTLEELRRAGGPATFRDFMEAALYDPDEGFYGAGRVRFGARGDFSTSSTLHPVFGEVLAAWAVEAWEALGRPSPFAIVEAGPGDGSLARAVVASLAGAPRELRARLVLVERSRALVARQREALADAPTGVEWTGLERLAAAPVVGVLLSNELVDALPVHVARAGGGRVEEMYVRFADGAWAARWATPSTPALARYIGRYAPLLLAAADPHLLAVGLDAVEWLGAAARALADGFLLTVDYGDAADRLYEPGRDNGVRAFRGHALAPDPLAEPGALDLTASVNFSALEDAGRDAGLETACFESQREFLGRYDLAGRVARRAGGSDLAGRLAMKTLLAPGGLSDPMRVLVQRRRPVPESGHHIVR